MQAIGGDQKKTKTKEEHTASFATTTRCGTEKETFLVQTACQERQIMIFRKIYKKEKDQTESQKIPAEARKMRVSRLFRLQFSCPRMNFWTLTLNSIYKKMRKFCKLWMTS